MSCGPGKPCEEGKKRRIAFGALGVMAIIFIALSAASFLDSRKQVTPDGVQYGTYDAVQGKRVFQAYNCMGCHTIVGNGAYLGPDLTDIYAKAGPAWLAAFLPSAGSWPTGPALQVHLQKPEQVAASGAGDLDSYLQRYPGAAERIHRRGGGTTYMPNLSLTGEEIGQLIAFFKYTSEMNTEGWPPKPAVDGLESPLARPFPVIASASAAEAPAESAADPSLVATDAATLGAAIVQQYACTACHSLDHTRRVGPGWGGLYGSQVTLADGSTVVADEAYLAASIREPDAAIVAGYMSGAMPAYGTMLEDDEVDAVVTYIRTLPGDGQ